MEEMDGRILQLIKRLQFDSEVNNLTDESAQEFNITSLYLNQLFKKQSGKTILQFVHDLKLEKAKELLETTYKNVKEIFHEIGYHGYTHFLCDFKKKYGISPKGIQRQHWLDHAKE